MGLFQRSVLKKFLKQQDKEAQKLKAEVEKTEKEIDKMVYELYGLTEEGI